MIHLRYEAQKYGNHRHKSKRLVVVITLMYELTTDWVILFHPRLSMRLSSGYYSVYIIVEYFDDRLCTYLDVWKFQIGIHYIIVVLTFV